MSPELAGTPTENSAGRITTDAAHLTVAAAIWTSAQ